MPSETDICNQALTIVGDQRISSLDDDNNRARIADLFYADTRDAMLRAHPFGFAKTRSALALMSTTPPFGIYGYQFKLPVSPKCLRVLEIDEDYPGQIPYSVEGRKLLCNETTASIIYIGQITETGLFDAMFTDCLVARLAMSFALALTKQKTIVEMTAKIYEMRIQETKTTDGLEAPKQVIYNAELTGVR